MYHAGKGGRGGKAQGNLSLIASAFSAGGRRRPEASVEVTATEKGGGRNIRAGVDCVKMRLRRQTGERERERESWEKCFRNLVKFTTR